MTSTPASRNASAFVWNILKIVLALGLVIFVISRTDVSSFVLALKNASIPWVIISGVLFLLLTLLKALQYYILMRNKLTYPQVLNVVIWQNVISNFFLAGAGIATYITMTRVEHEVKISRSLTIFLLTKVGDLTTIWLALLISSNLVWSEIGALQIPVIILAAGVGVLILFFLLTVLFRQRFVSILNRMLEQLKLSKIKLVEKGLHYLQSLADMGQNKVFTTFGLLLLSSFAYLIVTLAWMYANLAIFHLQPDIPAIVFVGALIQLVSYFPISVFGGLGITETSSLYFWSFFSFPQDVLAPALIGIRVIFYLFNLIPLIYLPLYTAFLNKENQAQNE